MSFTITKDELDYPREILSLNEMLRERVSYFKSIVSSNQKHIELTISGECHVEMSRVELIRLIDNNLSNAIKYSSKNSRIVLRLDTNKLSFYNSGQAIQNHKTIFDKYVRENSVIGGYGLGLSIVKDIAKRYGISIELSSPFEEGL
jgi:signal transduction histidine kinase